VNLTFKTTSEIMQANVDETDRRGRVNAGYQCPECDGVNIDTPYRFLTKEQPDPKFECRDCGCSWRKGYYPRAAHKESQL
jgi:hypothetical protein